MPPATTDVVIDIVTKKKIIQRCHSDMTRANSSKEMMAFSNLPGVSVDTLSLDSFVWLFFLNDI